MKLYRNIIILLLVCSFTYGETIKEYLISLDNEKKDVLEKLQSIKNPNHMLNEYDIYYKKYLTNEISTERYVATLLANRSEKHGTRLGYDYTNDKNGKTIDIIDTWEDFLLNNKNLEYKIRSRFINTIFGVYENGFKNKEFNRVSTHKDFNNEGFYYLVVGYVTRFDQDGVFITSSLTEHKYTLLPETNPSSIDNKIFKYPAIEIYVDNVPKDQITFIQNYLKEYYKQYPLISFIIEGNGVFEKNIPKGTYISGNVYNSHRP